MGQRGFSRVEDIVQDLVEGTFGRLFGGRLEPLEVANHMVRAIEDDEREGQISLHCQVAFNPDDFHILTCENPNLASELSQAAQQLGRRMGVNGSDIAQVRLVVDPNLKRGRLKISTAQDESDRDDDQVTQTYRHNTQREDYLRNLQKLDAFLIVQGRRHIHLNQPVLSIGRRTENDIVLDLSSVSRHHVQIRWRFGNFILYDISSRGSTSVNGHPTQEHVLRPGDVIALGEALIVYGEGIESKTKDRRENADDDGTLARSPSKP